MDHLYIKRNDGGRGLISIEQRVRGEENSLGIYVLNSEETLIKGVAATSVIETDKAIRKDEFRRNDEEKRKQKWKDKIMYGQFLRQMPEESDKEKGWKWLSSGDLKVGTKDLICAAQ